MGGLELGEGVGGGSAVAVGVAGLGEEYLAVAIDEEGGRVGGLFGGVPAQAVEVGEGVVGIDDEVEVGGELLVCVGLGDGLFGALVELCGWAGIDEQDLSSGFGELVGAGDEVVDLLLAVGALVAGVAAQEDEDDVAFGGEIGEVEPGAFGSGEGKVGGILADGGGLGCGRCGSEG